MHAHAHQAQKLKNLPYLSHKYKSRGHDTEKAREFTSQDNTIVNLWKLALWTNPYYTHVVTPCKLSLSSCSDSTVVIQFSPSPVIYSTHIILLCLNSDSLSSATVNAQFRASLLVYVQSGLNSTRSLQTTESYFNLVQSWDSPQIEFLTNCKT